MGNQIGGAAHDFGCGDIACCSEAQHGVRASQNVYKIGGVKPCSIQRRSTKVGWLNGQDGPASSTKHPIDLLLGVSNANRTNGKAGVSGGVFVFLHARRSAFRSSSRA